MERMHQHKRAASNRPIDLRILVGVLCVFVVAVVVIVVADFLVLVMKQRT